VYGPSQIYHTYFSPGIYNVTLMVVDSSGLSASVSHSVNVIPRPEHDVALAFINVFPNVAISSPIVDVEVGVLNTGSGNDTVSVTVYANSTPVSTLPGIFI